MKIMKYGKTKHFVAILTFFFVATLFSCLDDDNNITSSITADFGMLTTNSLAQTVGFITDDDNYLTFYEPLSIGGAVADTTYRAFVYYYPVDGASTIGLYAFTLVSVCEPKAAREFETIKTDPVASPEVWISNNNSYINIAMEVYSSSSDNPHIVGIVRTVDEENGNMTTLTLYHDQNNVPEYYLTTIYLSIPIKGYFQSGEQVNIVINTYEKGETSQIITIPQLFVGAEELID